MKVYLVIQKEFYDEGAYDVYTSEIMVFDTLDKANACARLIAREMPFTYATEEKVRNSGCITIMVRNDKGEKYNRIVVVDKEVG